MNRIPTAARTRLKVPSSKGRRPMSTQNTRPVSQRRPSTIKQIEQALDSVYDGIAREVVSCV